MHLNAIPCGARLIVVVSINYVSEPFSELMELTSPRFNKLFVPIFQFLTVDSGCKLEVKSDYATFSIEQGVVGAVYPLDECIDLVLAIPFESGVKSIFLAVDRDYKWRNLPAGVSIDSAPSAKVALVKAKEAFERVQGGVVIEQDGDMFSRPKAAFQPAFKKKLRYR